MGRRKAEEIVEAAENLELEPGSEQETVSEELSAEGEETEVEAVAEEAAEKPKRQRRPRKPRVQAKEEATEEIEVEAIEEESVEAVAEEAHEDKPKRAPRRNSKKAVTPEAQIELATEAMQKTMEEMAGQWKLVQDITTNISSQLEKVAHIVKPNIQEFMDTQDMVRPQNPKSQFLSRFTMVASVVAVLFSLVSLSLSQSARQVALNSEATRIANSQIFSNKPAPTESLAYTPREAAPAPAPRKSIIDNFVGPRQKAGMKARR